MRFENSKTTPFLTESANKDYFGSGLGFDSFNKHVWERTDNLIIKGQSGSTIEQDEVSFGFGFDFRTILRLQLEIKTVFPPAPSVSTNR